MGDVCSIPYANTVLYVQVKFFIHQKFPFPELVTFLKKESPDARIDAERTIRIPAPNTVKFVLSSHKITFTSALGQNYLTRYIFGLYSIQTLFKSSLKPALLMVHQRSGKQKDYTARLILFFFFLLALTQ